MSTTVSKSPKHEEDVPSREERDESYSTGAGKKAVEVAKTTTANAAQETCETKEKSCDSSDKTSVAKKLEAPIGLDNETRANSEH